MKLFLHSTAVRIRLAAVAVGATLLVLIPTGAILGLPSLCLFRNLFGVECLGCGMVRAASRLAHADLAGAAEFNRLVFPVAALICVMAARDLVQLLRKRRAVQGTSETP